MFYFFGLDSCRVTIFTAFTEKKKQQLILLQLDFSMKLVFLSSITITHIVLIVSKGVFLYLYTTEYLIETEKRIIWLLAGSHGPYFWDNSITSYLRKRVFCGKCICLENQTCCRVFVMRNGFNRELWKINCLACLIVRCYFFKENCFGTLFYSSFLLS